MTWNKNASTSIHEYLGPLLNHTVTLNQNTYDLITVFVQNPLNRWLKGFITYVSYLGLDREIRPTIFGIINGFDFDIFPYIETFLKEQTNNYQNFCLDEHTDIIYTTDHAKEIKNSRYVCIAHSHAYCLTKILLWTKINNQKPPFPHKNASDIYGVTFYQLLIEFYNKNLEFKNKLDQYLTEDINFYNNQVILSNERDIQRYYTSRSN